MNKDWTTKPIVSVTLENGETMVFDKPTSINFTNDIVFNFNETKEVILLDIDNKEFLRSSKYK
jgi:hypothetical protein